MRQNFSFPKAASLGALLSLFLLILPWHLKAQGTGAPIEPSCTVFKKLGGIPSDYNGQVYYDRFGNTWSEDEILDLSTNVNDDCTAGIFALDFSGAYTIDERDAVCDALSYLSSIVGGGAPNGVVPIKIEFANGVGGAAASSFMRLECGVMKNFPLLNIRTGNNALPPSFFAGLIRIDQNLDWHTGAMPTDLADWNANFTGKVDLFTAVLHEGLHILGIASTFGGVELVSGGTVEGFTDWDNYLFKQNGTNAYTKLTISAQDAECCGRMTRNPAAPTAFAGDCNENIMFQVNNVDIAEVTRNGQNNNDVSGVNNRLSHLDIQCGPGDQYVMHPTLPISPNLYSFPRRMLTQAESDILCSIGYPAAGSCDNCVVVAEDDVIDEIIFLSGQNANNPLSINVFLNGLNSFLLDNDVFDPSEITFELCGFDPGIEVEYLPLINGIQITGLSPGVWEFCYSISSCNGFCDEATVQVTVLDHPIPTGCVSDDCNLVCFGDFEDFLPTYGSYHTQIGLPQLPFFVTGSGGNDNSVDIYIANGITQALGWQNGSFNISNECPQIPLSVPIQPGCTATIRFSVAAIPDNINTIHQPTIGLFGISGAPCSEISPPSCQTAQFTLCSTPNIVEGVCLTSQDFPNDMNGIPITPSFGDILPTNIPTVNGINWEEFVFTWENQSLFPITDILLWGFTQDGIREPYAYFIDNITVTSTCNTQIQITPTILSQCIGGQAIIQYEVCLLGSGQNPVAINLQADIPFGLTAVPGGGFDANGIANFSLVPGTECNGGANTTIITLTMDVSPNFDPAQAPIPIVVPLEFVGTGLCIDPTGGGGDVTLMLQDCSIPQAACHCPPNTGFEVGVNMDSQTELSMSGIPVTLENTCLTVNGKLFVDEHFTLRNTEVILNQGAEIIVSHQNKLEITDFSRLYGCEHMWRGITVENGASLKMTDNSTIEDAQWAIQAQNESTLEVTDCTFNSNYTGIYVPVSANGAAQTVNIVAIKENQFSCWAPLKPAYTVTGDPNHQQLPIPGTCTYAGIAINDVASFDIGENNKFDEIRNGVFAVRSGFTMKRCTIRNLVTDPIDLNTEFNYNVDQHGVYATYCPLAIVNYCQFFNFGKGIFSEASNITADLNIMTGYAVDSPAEDIGIECSLNTNRSVRIRANTITMWGTGIRVTNALPASILRIKNNAVKMRPGSSGQHIDLQTIRGGLVTGNTLTREDNTALGIGINMLTCSSISIQSNNMLNIERGTATSGCTGNVFGANDAVNGGIWGYAAFNSTDTYCSNKSQDQTESGFYFRGMCIKSNALRCNNINNAADNGLNLWANGPNSTKIGTQTNGGNKWLGMYGDFGAYNASINQFDILESRFLIPANQTPTWSTGLGQAILWFDNFPGTSINCLTACPLVVDTDEDEYPTGGEGGGYGGQGYVDNADVTTAQNGHYGAGFNWMARQRLYERLRMYPALAAQNPYVQQFYNAAPYTDLGQLVEVGEDLILLQGRDAYTWGALRDLQTEIAALSDELQTLRAVGPGSNFNAWWLQVRLLQQDIKQAVNRLRGHENWLDGRRQADLPAILAANAGVSTSHLCALNQRTINNIYVGNSLWKPNPLSAATLLDVKTIADQCPLDGGFAVYEARSLYRRFVPSATWSENSGCSALRLNERSIFNLEEDGKAFMLVPNPADETLSLLPVSEQEAISFQLYNLKGELVLSETIESVPPNSEIQVSTLPAGVYFYRITNQGKSIQSGKVIIAH